MASGSPNANQSDRAVTALQDDAGSNPAWVLIEAASDTVSAAATATAAPRASLRIAPTARQKKGPPKRAGPSALEVVLQISAGTQQSI